MFLLYVCVCLRMCLYLPVLATPKMLYGDVSQLTKSLWFLKACAYARSLII